MGYANSLETDEVIREIIIRLVVHGVSFGHQHVSALIERYKGNIVSLFQIDENRDSQYVVFRAIE